MRYTVEPRWEENKDQATNCVGSRTQHGPVASAMRRSSARRANSLERRYQYLWR